MLLLACSKVEKILVVSLLRERCTRILFVVIRCWWLLLTDVRFVIILVVIFVVSILFVGNACWFVQLLNSYCVSFGPQIMVLSHCGKVHLYSRQMHCGCHSVESVVEVRRVVLLTHEAFEVLTSCIDFEDDIVLLALLFVNDSLEYVHQSNHVGLFAGLFVCLFVISLSLLS